MVFKGRTVIAFLLVAVFASCILTLTIVSPSAAAGFHRSSPTDLNGLTSKDIDKFKTTYDLIEQNYVNKVDHDALMTGAINGMLGALDDPFSTYMDQKEAAAFNDSISSSFQGIGAEVSLEDGKVTIMSPIKGSPAEQAGLKANDVIVSVNGESLDGLTLSQAVMKIRGPKGTQAKLSVQRAGASEPIDVIVVRGEIPLETVTADMLPGNIGKIEISQFSTNTADRFKQELTKLEQQGMKALVIDVRDDPGGILPVVVNIAQNFVPNGKPIVQIENRDGQKQPTLSTNLSAPKPYPVAILINAGSASASEILAGALKESVPGALVVGTTSFGKGTVQVTYEKEMGDGSNLKLTTYKWLTPLGNWIHKKGIDPTVKVEEPDYFLAKPFSRKSTLKADTVGDDVKSLQIILGGLGYTVDRKDGYFSAQTVQAVKAFQKDQGVAQTGEVDTSLMDKLEKAIVDKIKDPHNDAQLNAAIQGLTAQLQGK